MKLGWQLFIVVAAIVTGLYLSRKPWQVYRQQQAQANERTAEMREAELEREKLLGEKRDYSSALGLEKKLRDKGYRKAGEIPASN